jgi:AcrR family transcriptional regulator
MCAAESRKPGRPKDPDLEGRRKAQILATAGRVFATFGFANTQVQTIANHLGVGNGTVYRYFPTKEQLFLSAVELGLKELEAEMDAVMAQPHTGADLIRAAVRAYLGFFHRRPEMAELFIQERAAFPHHHRPLYFATKDDERECQHRAFFARLVESGVIRAVPQERFFNVIGDLLYGTILTNLLTGRANDPAAQAEDVLDVILNGLLAPSSGDAVKG